MTTVYYLLLCAALLFYSCAGWVITFSLLPLYVYPVGLGLVLGANQLFHRLARAGMPLPFVMLCLFAAWTFVSAGFAEDSARAYLGALGWLAGIFLTAFAFVAITSFDRFVTLMRFFTVIHLAGALLAAAQILYGLPYLSPSVYPGGPAGFEGMNFLLGKNYIPIVALGLSILVGHRRSGDAASRRLVRTGRWMLAVGVFGIGVSWSRSTQIGTLVGVVAFLAATGNFRVMARAGLVAVAGAVLFSWQKWSRLLDNGRLELTDSDTTRFYLWSSAKEMVLDNPVVGVGENNFKPRVLDYPPPHWTDTVPYAVQQGQGLDPHNVPLGVLAQDGIPGFVLFFACFALTLKHSYEDLARPGRDEGMRILGGAVFTYLLAFGIDMNFHNYFNDNNIWVMLGAYYGVRFGQRRSAVARPPTLAGAAAEGAA